MLHDPITLVDGNIDGSLNSLQRALPDRDSHCSGNIPHLQPSAISDNQMRTNLKSAALTGPLESG